MLFHFFIFIFLIIYSNCILPDEKRKELLERLTRKIDLTDNTIMFPSEPIFYENENIKFNVNYDVAKINETIEKYNFPTNFNYLEEYNITPKIKDQKDCGSCWAFATTSALAYRYKKKYGIDLDLSPQDGVSCYLKNCNSGNYPIDGQLNLMKNGTLTEGCFPFTMEGPESAMPPCPLKCKDGSEFKRYYSQNVYSTEDIIYGDYEKEFYNLVALIMDQLITKGPVVTDIDVYTDLFEWTQKGYNCKNDAYAPGEDVEQKNVAHAMVIVGYGFLELKNKFYWLVQNSWGEKSCLNGFLRIEFGKTAVEHVSFAEPYLQEKEKVDNVTNVDINFLGFDAECNLLIQTDNNLNISFEWNNTLEIKFKHIETNQDFNYYCSSNNFPQGNQVKCFFEVLNYFKPKGEYIFDSWKTIGKEMNFSLNESFIGKNFFFYGYDEIGSYYDEFYEHYFISEVGAKLVFYYGSPSGIDIVPHIYPTIKYMDYLKKCEKVMMNDFEDGIFYFIVCEVQEDEMELFNTYNPKQPDNLYSLMFYDIFCYEIFHTFTFTDVINKNEYPVFNITEVYYKSNSQLIKGEDLIVYAENIGNIAFISDEDFIFFAFIYLTNNETEHRFYTEQIHCTFSPNEKNKVKYRSECHVYLIDAQTVKFNELYLLPYILPYQYPTGFDVLIKDKMKVKLYKEDNNDNNNNTSSYNKINSLLLFFIIVLLALF